MKYLMIFCCACATCCFGQPGFNKHFDFGGRSTGGVNMLVDNDTIVVYGLSLSPPPSFQWGVLFAKLDSFGNVLKSTVVYDTAGGHFADIKNADIKKLSNGSGYVLVGSLYSRDAGFLMQFDKEGNLISYWEYPDIDIRAMWCRKVIEVTDGFLLFGSKQKLDFFQDAFVLKVDKQGNKLWEKSYETPGLEHNLGCAFQMDENTFVIGSNPYKHYPAVGSKSRIWAIDSMGNLLWAWETPTFFEEGGVVGLNPTSDGGWIYTTGELFGSAPDWLVSTKIVKRGSNFQLEWQRYINPPAYFGNTYAIDMKSTGVNNYIALGNWHKEVGNGGEPYQGGSLYKISENGDSLWSRLDTALFDHYGYDLNEYSGVGVLSSGSIVAFGHAIQDFPGIGGLYAWLVKVDSDGCMDTLLCSTSNTGAAPKEPETDTHGYCQVFPNPAKDVVTFSWEMPVGEKAVIEIFNTQGIRIQAIPVQHGIGQVQWRADTPGLFFTILSQQARARFQTRLWYTNSSGCASNPQHTCELGSLTVPMMCPVAIAQAIDSMNEYALSDAGSSGRQCTLYGRVQDCCLIPR